jgi:hypothetical protein
MLIREAVSSAIRSEAPLGNVYTMNWKFVRQTTEQERVAAELFYDTHRSSLGYEDEGNHGVEDDYYGWREDGQIVLVPWSN